MIPLQIAIKRMAERFPYSIGRHLVRVPFSIRLGRAYSRSRADILEMEALDEESLWPRLFPRLQRIVRFAYDRVPFYARFYDRHGFHPDDLRRPEDFARVPIVTRSDLQAETIEERGHRERGRVRINTGGTSGQPLEFYVDRRAFARELAHMHVIWERLGYRTTDLKLTFRGRARGERILAYNAVHNEFLVNPTRSLTEIVAAVEHLTKCRPIRFLHGYPSLVHEFAVECLERRPVLADKLSASLKGILLGSEYPAPQYREAIHAAFRCPTISWYGHSEMAILAPEVEPGVYRPFPSYGFTEAVPDRSGAFRLVGTSYDNTASPFIRYDTGDLVHAESGLLGLRSFRIEQGRIGDFVVLGDGRRIGLTALVFGRHHRLFAWARFVQIRQERPGHATVLVTVAPGAPHTAEDAARDFDASGVALRCEFEIRERPFRTASGKTPLLVPSGIVSDSPSHPRNG